VGALDVGVGWCSSWRAELVNAALNLDTREVPRPIAEGLCSDVVKKRGQQCATFYSAVTRKKRGSKYGSLASR